MGRLAIFALVLAGTIAEEVKHKAVVVAVGIADEVDAAPTPNENLQASDEQLSARLQIRTLCAAPPSYCDDNNAPCPDGQRCDLQFKDVVSEPIANYCRDSIS